MTKYDKSIIYKLCSKDTSITDIYIGSTINFRNRKYNHKKDCNNSNRKTYTSYKYEFIRNNGGWDNWDMIQIKEVSCNNKRELEAEERKVYEELKPTLNIYRPSITINERNDTDKIRKKNWYENNKQKTIDKAKLLNEKNKKIIVTCECGSILQKSCLSKHKKSKKHIMNLVK